MLQTTSSISLKKGDKITMALIGVIGLCAFTAIGYIVLPYILIAMVNTLYLLGMAGTAVFIGASLWENRTNILYSWKNMSRNIARGITRENPLGVMDTAISRFEKKLESIGENLSKAKAALNQQKDAIQKATAEQEAFERQVMQAQRQGMEQTSIDAIALKAERRRKSAENMLPLATLMDQVYTKLTEARQVCMLKLEDMKDQREVFGREYATMMAGKKAVGSFKSFFASNPDLERLQMSIEEIDTQTAQAEAEIDQFLMDIKPAVDSAQLQKSADAAAAIDRVNKSKLLSGASTEGRLLEVKQAELVGK